MRFTLDLDGIIMNLQIRNYQKVPKDDIDHWCKVDFSFVSEPWLDYSKEHDEVFLCSEIDDLIEKLELLLSDQLTEPTEYACVEPDFSFMLYPEEDLRKNPKYLYIKPGYEIVDIFMEWKIAFWYNGLTSNWLTVTLGRRDIEKLLSYLQLVSGRVSEGDPTILALMEDHTISR